MIPIFSGKYGFFIFLLIGSVVISACTVFLGIKVTSEHMPSWSAEMIFILLYMFWSSVLHAFANSRYNKKDE